MEITYQINGFALFGKNFGKDKERVGGKRTCIYYSDCFEFDLRGPWFGVWDPLMLYSSKKMRMRSGEDKGWKWFYN